MSMNIDVETVTTTVFKGARLHASSVGSWAEVGGPPNSVGNVDLEVAPRWSANGLRELSTFASKVADVLDGTAAHPHGADKKGNSFKVTSPDVDDGFAKEKVISVRMEDFHRDVAEIAIECPSDIIPNYKGRVRISALRELRDNLTEFLGE